MGLAMLASGLVRNREAPLPDVRRMPGGGDAPLVSAGTAEVEGTVELEPDAGDAQGDEADGELSSPSPGPGDWQIACQLKSGAPLIFDRTSLRELGAMMLFKWAAPGDPRVHEGPYTALVSCSEKSIEASWPGTRSETRAGTCGRQLIEAVCATSSKSQSRTVRKPR